MDDNLLNVKIDTYSTPLNLFLAHAHEITFDVDWIDDQPRS